MTPDAFVQRCNACVAAGGASAEIAALVCMALPSQRDEPSWWDLPEFVQRSERLLIVNLTLPPFAVTPIHDHGTWAVVGISTGCEVDRLFVRRGARVHEDGEVTLGAGSSVELSSQVIHAIFNPLRIATRGIHVYGGDLISAPRRMWHPTTGELAYDGPTFEAWCEELISAAARASLARQQMTSWDL